MEGSARGSHSRLKSRAFHRVLKLARTIADLAGAEQIQATHLTEAIPLRSTEMARVRRKLYVDCAAPLLAPLHITRPRRASSHALHNYLPFDQSPMNKIRHEDNQKRQH